MAIFLSFLPWFVFWLFLSFNEVEIAAIGGFTFALLEMLFDLWKKISIKILQFGSFIFFFIIGVLYFFINLEWLRKWVSPLGGIALTSIILISLLIKKPFTLQYAKEITPKKKWNNSKFIHANYVVTWAWFFCLLINSIFSILFSAIFSVELYIHWLLSLFFFGIAILFTNLYRKLL